MNYWWVNQNQTFKHETSGGYMWSPKRKSNGAHNVFYDNMTKVGPGDIVFSFADSQIPFIGIITSKGYNQAKPQFGAIGNAWEGDGWMVNVDYKEVKNVITPSHHMDILAPLLPKKYAPLQPNGRGLQGVYLTELPQDFAEKLLELIGDDVNSILQQADEAKGLVLLPEEAVDERLIQLIRKRKDISDTEKETIIKARNGQGRFRQDVLDLHKSCPFTGIADENFLKAGHIKPWSKCSTNEERLDPLNGLSLTPTADHLFDKGYISFDMEGKAIFSNAISQSDLKSLGFSSERSVYRIVIHDEKQLGYLAFHRNNIFKKQGF